MNKYKNIDELLKYTAVIDTETTGARAGEDECVQVSIVRGDGIKLLDTLVRPIHNKEWPDASRVNGIYPGDVRSAPTFKEIIPRINAALEGIRLIVGYNLPFDIEIMRGCGYNFPSTVEKFQDIMAPFAVVFGEYSYYWGNYKWQSLSTCSSYYGFDEKKNAPKGIGFHNSLFDCYATLHCFKAMVAAGQLTIKFTQVSNEPVITEKTLKKLLHETFVIDIETTGNKLGIDECVRLTIMRGDGELEDDRIFKPKYHKSWSSSVPGIRPQKLMQTFDEAKYNYIEWILRGAKFIAMYDLSFCKSMIETMGYRFNSNARLIDISSEFSKKHGCQCKNCNGIKHPTLEQCTAFYGMTSNDVPPTLSFGDSLYGCYSAVFCLRKMLQCQEIEYLYRDLLDTMDGDEWQETQTTSFQERLYLYIARAGDTAGPIATWPQFAAAWEMLKTKKKYPFFEFLSDYSSWCDGFEEDFIAGDVSVLVVFDALDFVCACGVSGRKSEAKEFTSYDFDLGVWKKKAYKNVNIAMATGDYKDYIIELYREMQLSVSTEWMKRWLDNIQEDQDPAHLDRTFAEICFLSDMMRGFIECHKDEINKLLAAFK